MKICDQQYGVSSDSLNDEDGKTSDCKTEI